jgi:molybdopterin-binding protein
MLEMVSVRHRYGPRAVLEIETFRLDRGAAVAIVGPNGAGKSTLLRLLAGIEQPSEGAIVFAQAASTTGLRRHVTLVEQRPLLFRGTVRDNLEFGLRVRRLSAAERRARALTAAERLAVGHLTGRSASELSEGEIQRVAVARAVALAPDALLLDEPLSASDRESTRLLYDVLDEERERGVAVCLASHQLEDAYRWTSDVRALAAGRVTSVTPENLFRVELSGDGETKRARVGRTEVVVLTDREGPAVLAIPPEDIVVSRAPLGSSARNTVTGRVRRIVERGLGEGGVAITVDCGVDLTATVTHSAIRELSIAPGDDVVLSFKASAVRIF